MYQPTVTARAKRQSQGIKQDRLAGSGLAGQHAQSGAKIQIQAVNQDNITDGKAGQHRSSANGYSGATQGRHVSIRGVAAG